MDIRGFSALEVNEGKLPPLDEVPDLNVPTPGIFSRAAKISSVFSPFPPAELSSGEVESLEVWP